MAVDRELHRPLDVQVLINSPIKKIQKNTFFAKVENTKKNMLSVAF